MRRAGLILAILALSCFVAQSQTVLVIKNVTVIDMVGQRPKPRMTVVVEGNRIARIGRGLRTPRGARAIDGRGKFLIPGLWDMHVHALRKDRSDPFSQLFLANGVTGIRDTGTTAEGLAMLPNLNGVFFSRDDLDRLLANVEAAGR